MRAFPSLFKTALDLAIPLRCVSCGDILETRGLCQICWAHISFITKPFCAWCGLPFDFNVGEESLCAPCSHTPPLYTTARSVFVYTNESKDLILRFKHQDNLSSLPLFSSWMARCASPEKEALCLPVPLHWTRLFMRTYNQAALLARELARLKGWTYEPSVLLRKRRTSSQGHFSKRERLNNVKNAFEVPLRKRPFLEGKTII